MAKGRVMGKVGVGADAEDVYRTLLVHPGLTTRELSALISFGSSRLRAALSELERLAIITRLSGSPARFQPAPPDVVAEALVSSREEELRQFRLEARELLELRRLYPEQANVAEIVEIVMSREAFVQRWSQVQTVTRHSLEGFMRPPFAQPRIGDDEAVQSGMIQRGVVSRGIYDQEALASPGILEHVWRMVDEGEKARVVTGLPMKMTISDRRVALVPYGQDPERIVDAGLLVHKSTLLDALTRLFDIYWERGVDIRPGVVPDSRPDSVAPEDKVVGLMASGLKDDAIARHLGVSTPTIRRRISDVLRRLGVTTRFQAGLVLGRRRALHEPDGEG